MVNIQENQSHLFVLIVNTHHGKYWPRRSTRTHLRQSVAHNILLSNYCLFSCFTEYYIITNTDCSRRLCCSSSTTQAVVFDAEQGPSCSWSYGSWICNYLRNQCIPPLISWVWIPLMVRCTLCNIMWQSLLITCGRSVVYTGFLPK
jgi:hypothetical protein